MELSKHLLSATGSRQFSVVSTETASRKNGAHSVVHSVPIDERRCWGHTCPVKFKTQGQDNSDLSENLTGLMTIFTDISWVIKKKLGMLWSYCIFFMCYYFFKMWSFVVVRPLRFSVRLSRCQQCLCRLVPRSKRKIRIRTPGGGYSLYFG